MIKNIDVHPIVHYTAAQIEMDWECSCGATNHEEFSLWTGTIGVCCPVCSAKDNANVVVTTKVAIEGWGGEPCE